MWRPCFDRQRWFSASVLVALGCACRELDSDADAAALVGVARAEPREGGRDAALHDVPDSIVQKLAEQEVSAVRKGQGGRSLAFVVTLQDQTVGYFKPEQTFAANWYSEIASYHLDRELGLGKAPPAVGRKLPWAVLKRAAGDDPRVRELRIRGGTLRGALTAWIPKPLDPLVVLPGWQRWLTVDPPPALSPFQRPETYSRAKQRGQASSLPAEAPEPDRRDRPAELSDLILFDYLIGNLDRWGGGFTNVRTRGPGGPLVYLDNANGFPPAQVGKSRLLDVRLESVQRFRRKTVEAIRKLDGERFRSRLAKDPLAPLLDDAQLRELETRRARLLAHVDHIERTKGSAAFPW